MEGGMRWTVKLHCLTCASLVQVYVNFNRKILVPICYRISLIPHSNVFKMVVQPPTPNPSGECPDNFEDLDPNSEYCYYISDNNDLRSWGDAYGNCAYFGSSLASIHSDDAMVKIQNALNGRSADVWIGLQADGKYPTFIFYYTTY